MSPEIIPIATTAASDSVEGRKKKSRSQLKRVCFGVGSSMAPVDALSNLQGIADGETDADVRHCFAGTVP